MGWKYLSIPKLQRLSHVRKMGPSSYHNNIAFGWTVPQVIHYPGFNNKCCVQFTRKLLPADTGQLCILVYTHKSFIILVPPLMWQSSEKLIITSAFILSYHDGWWIHVNKFKIIEPLAWMNRCIWMNILCCCNWDAFKKKYSQNVIYQIPTKWILARLSIFV